MPGFTDLAGLAGSALALAALCALALRRVPVARRGAAPAAGLVFVLLLLPLAELPLAAYVRGMIGDLSVSTLFLLAYAATRQTGGLPPDVPRRIGAWLLPALAAAVLYPLALGAAPYDSYRWGYGEPWFLALLLALALAGTALRRPLVALSISLAVLAWALGWYESGNLWDYLIDPLLAIYAVFSCLSACFSLRRSGQFSR